MAVSGQRTLGEPVDLAGAGQPPGAEPSFERDDQPAEVLPAAWKPVNVCVQQTGMGAPFSYPPSAQQFEVTDILGHDAAIFRCCQEKNLLIGQAGKLRAGGYRDGS